MSETEVVPNGTPIIVHEGRYRLYQKPDGGLHLVYRRTDAEQDDHMEIPGVMVKLFNAGAEGKLTPMEMMREVMKLRGQV